MHISSGDMSVGVLLLNQLLSIKRAGYDVVAVCSPGPYVQRTRDAGIRVSPVRIVRAITPLADLRAIAKLTRIIRRERPAIVHTHTPKAALLGQYAALLARVPIRVHTIHGLYFPRDMTSRTRPLYIALERLTMKFAHLALAQNPEDIPVAIEQKICNSTRIEYLGNGINLAAFDPARVKQENTLRLRRDHHIDNGEQVVGIVGRVNLEKGYVEFFQAAARIAARAPATKFVVVGPVEPEKSNALDPLALAEEYGVADKTVYLGLRDDMADIYSMMDICVLPSHREGFPRSIMEAAAMAKPVVATDIRGCRQVVVEGETGFLIPVGDSEALADRVLQLLLDDDLAATMGHAARRHAIDAFDESAVVERILSAYDKLLSTRARNGSQPS